VTPQIARLATIEAAKLLQAEFPHVDTRLLDSEIWSFESRKAASKPRGNQIAGTEGFEA
jgi:hypothetical protein